MAARDPNVAKLQLVARALGPLREQMVFVGGCAVGLLITDEAAAPVRATLDVDLVVSVLALSAYHGIERNSPGSASGATWLRRRLSVAGAIEGWRSM